MVDLITKIILGTAEETDFFAYTNRYDNVRQLMRTKGQLLFEFKIDTSLVSNNSFAITRQGVEIYRILWIADIPAPGNNYTVSRVQS